MSDDIFEKFNSKTDEEFLELLIRADKEPIIEGIKMPGFPGLEFQKNSVGGRGADDLRVEPWRFVSLIREYARKLSVNINENTVLLDFGVGWGRMIRFFFKDIPSDNLYGIDTWDIMIDKCNKLLPSGSYSVNTPYPPTGFSDNTFDVIISYSVFSHLISDAAEMWIMEFARILKPNGIIVATTEGLRFLNLIEELQNDPERVKRHNWYGLLMKGYGAPVEEYRRRYFGGEFLYASSGRSDALDGSFYGDAIIPESHIKEVFGKYLEFRNFIDNESVPQAVFVLQKQDDKLRA